MNNELDEGQLAIIEKVRKLLQLAAKNSNEAEAAAATAKAQELLTAYNLDVAMVGEHGGDNKREEQRLKGGAYLYQRWLWEAVAELNFCIYWCDRRWTTYEVRGRDWEGKPTIRKRPRLQWHHYMVGRVVNVTATRIMAGYLEQAIERLVRERLADKVTGKVPHTALFSRWAVSFRTGAGSKIIEKIEERRNEVLAEEHRKKREAERAGVSTGTALTVAAYSKSEYDANQDAIHGEGWSAKVAAERARQAEARRQADEEYVRWAAAHPEEARKREAEARKEREQWERRRAQKAETRNRQFTAKQDLSAYYSGYDAGENVSIDPQVDSSANQRKLTHG